MGPPVQKPEGPGEATNSFQGCSYLKFLGSFFFFYPKDFFMPTIFQTLYWISFKFVSVSCFDFFCQWGMWDPSSLNRDRTCILCTGRQGLIYWTTGSPSLTTAFISLLSILSLLDFPFSFLSFPFRFLKHFPSMKYLPQLSHSVHSS